MVTLEDGYTLTALCLPALSRQVDHRAHSSCNMRIFSLTAALPAPSYHTSVSLICCVLPGARLISVIAVSVVMHSECDCCFPNRYELLI